MNDKTLNRIFCRMTVLVMTVLTAASASLLGDLLTLPPERLLSTPRRIEYILGSLVLYLAAVVAAARIRSGKAES